MPTLAGLRRRGYTPEAIRAFCERIGVAKTDSVVDVGLLEHGLRDDLNRRSPRVMAVLRPLKLVIENFPEGEVRELDAPLHPEDPAQGTRKVPFSRVRLRRSRRLPRGPAQGLVPAGAGARGAPALRLPGALHERGQGRERRGRRAARAPGIPASWGGNAPDGRTVRGTLHWVSAAHAVPAEVRLYDRLFSVENPGTDEAKSFLDEMNPDSLVQVDGRRAGAAPGDADRAGHARPVRARRLLLPRPRQRARQAGVEPDGRAQGQLGEDRGQGCARRPARPVDRKPAPTPRPARGDQKAASRRQARPRRSPSTISARSTCASGW